MSSNQPPSSSFTSQRLKLLHAMSRDPRVTDGHFRAAFRISQQVDEATGIAIISDETLCDELPKTDEKKLRLCRNALEEVEWWEVRRGGRWRASSYRFLAKNIDPISTVMASKKEARDLRNVKQLKKDQGGKSPCLNGRKDEIVSQGNSPAYDINQAGEFARVRQGKSPPLHTEDHTEDRFPLTVQDVATEPPSDEPFERSEWDHEDWQALYEERAGILEFDGGYSRAEAEERAALEISRMRAIA